MATKSVKIENKMTALYCRLSVEDGLDNVESNSITHQKDMLLKYAKDHGFGNCQIFTDDGVTGTSFNRPGLNAMLQEVNAGNVAVCIVKDQSRIGRDVLEVGLLKRQFEQNNVRFIAAADNLDTAKGFDIMAIMRDVINEMYVADTSKKIRAVQESKARDGKHIHPKAPFGYVPSEADKFRWSVDETAAEVVKEIFRLCVSGLGPTLICNELTARKIVNPSFYKAERLGKPITPEMVVNKFYWNNRTITDILKNIEYTGTAAIARMSLKSYKDHRIIHKPVEDWYIHENAHTAIIDKSTFETVQRIRNGRRRPTKKGDLGILNGFIYCQDCNERLHIKRSVFKMADGNPKEYTYYECQNYRVKKPSKKCNSHSVKKDELERLVLEDLQRVVGAARVDELKFAETLRKESGKESDKAVKKAHIELAKATARIKALDGIISKTFEQNLTGKVSDERFKILLDGYEGEQKELKEQAAQLEKLLHESERVADDTENFLNLVRKYTEITELTAEVVREFIDRIIIGEPVSTGYRQKTQEVRIVYNYIGEPTSELTETENNKA